MGFCSAPTFCYPYCALCKWTILVFTFCFANFKKPMEVDLMRPFRLNHGQQNV
ncbi:hypothetical protein BJX99DRAFT_228120 [Aspergillus californicus]